MKGLPPDERKPKLHLNMKGPGAKYWRILPQLRHNGGNCGGLHFTVCLYIYIVLPTRQKESERGVWPRISKIKKDTTSKQDFLIEIVFIRCIMFYKMC